MTGAFMPSRFRRMLCKRSRVANIVFLSALHFFTLNSMEASDVSTCDLWPTFTFQHSVRQENFGVQVYEVKRAGSAVAFWAPRLAVNTDGAPKSYSLDDPNGKTFALNSLRNGLITKCRQETFSAIVKRLRYLRDQGWPREADKTLIDKQVIDCLSSTVFPRTGGGEPCPEISLDGHRFLVSATALSDDIPDVCNPSKYVDSSRIPAVVLPADERFNGLMGKFALAWHPEREALVLGVVGDRGPKNELGEGSIALNARLLGVSKMPRSFPEVKRKLHISTPVFVMVLRDADGKDSVFKSRDDLAADAEAAWRSWMGSSVALRDVVSACALAASRPK